MFKSDSIRLRSKQLQRNTEKDTVGSNHESGMIVEWPGSMSCKTDSRPTVDAHDPRHAQRERSVTVDFAHATRVFFIEVDEEDNNAKWYSKMEYDCFKISIRSTARAVRKAIAAGKDISSVDGKRHCVRGIEFACSDKCAEAREKSVRAVIDAVLDEQKSQRSSGINDTCSIAEVSCILSMKSRKSALKLGKADARSARMLYKGRSEPNIRKPSRESLSPEAIRFRSSLMHEALSLAKDFHTENTTLQQISESR